MKNSQRDASLCEDAGRRPRAKGGGWYLVTRKGKETDSPLQDPERNADLLTS